MNKSSLIKTAMVAVVSLCLSAAALAADAAPAKDAKDATPDKAVATVNGKAITQRELDLAVNSYLRSVSSRLGGGHEQKLDGNDKIRKEMLTQMVDREVLYGEIEKHKYEGLDKKVDEELARAKSQYPSEVEFKKALEEDGLDDAMLLKLINRRYSLELYVEKFIVPNAKVTDEEAKKFYDDNPSYFQQEEMIRASHILITTKAEDDAAKKAEAKAKAEDIRAKLVAGGNFEELAKSSSDCPSKEQGGDLGYFGRGRMVKPFEDAAFALKVGELSPVIETEFGYHVIKSTEHKDAEKVPFDKVKDRIVSHLQDTKINETLKNKVEELKKAAKIVLM